MPLCESCRAEQHRLCATHRTRGSCKSSFGWSFGPIPDRTQVSPVRVTDWTSHHPEPRLPLVVAHCEFTGRAHGNSVHRARWLLAPVFAVSIAFLAIGMVVS
ncbi:MAG: hypothetical protein E5Y10_18835 [Mesorhizobium sp.]|nr:MAG: hypothetical protein EOS13_19920 [Mesorhizobium sp.]TIN26578.1 MAG: hypothetical protein E5Y19_13085 [Mesorhizobium sp.]TIN36509.1 MAG: hypothetical protein E5Y13_23585 [Mesorhizobium sp.]TJU83171.1 MAG: hypothetical protein E5Y15_14295 [Mesorhizobium sp.]TJU87762.1 MAG: hypothetical protein E5Y10_18835 [Mesorhizobium sp.]